MPSVTLPSMGHGFICRANSHFGRFGHGPADAAVANVFLNATGVRLRQYPLTPERVPLLWRPARLGEFGERGWRGGSGAANFKQMWREFGCGL
jgi:hypothetical protein